MNDVRTQKTAQKASDVFTVPGFYTHKTPGNSSVLAASVDVKGDLGHQSAGSDATREQPNCLLALTLA